jgi:hypothetical protein
MARALRSCSRRYSSPALRRAVHGSSLAEAGRISDGETAH